MTQIKNAVELAVQNYERLRGLTRGGKTALARDLGCSRISVQTWCRQGFVTIEWLEKFASLTQTRPIDLNPQIRRLAEIGAPEKKSKEVPA